MSQVYLVPQTVFQYGVTAEEAINNLLCAFAPLTETIGNIEEQHDQPFEVTTDNGMVIKLPDLDLGEAR
jgi:hypothetical protein